MGTKGSGELLCPAHIGASAGWCVCFIGDIVGGDVGAGAEEAAAGAMVPASRGLPALPGCAAQNLPGAG